MFDFLSKAATSIFGHHSQHDEETPRHTSRPSFLGLGGGPVDGIMSALGHYAEQGRGAWLWKDPLDPDAPAQPDRTAEAADHEERLRDSNAEQRVAAKVEAEAQADPTFAKDPVGARKRAQELISAKNDIGALFEIVDGRVAEKDRKQNQVTEQELREIAMRYANVKAGRGDLQISPTTGTVAEKDAFKRAALDDIARIMQTRSGRDLVNGLDVNPDAYGKHYVTTLDRSTGFSLGATENPITSGSHMSNIEYEAGKQGDVVTARDYESWAHLLRSDVTLYHELTHAYHNSRRDGGGEDQVVGLHDYAPGGKHPYKFNENRYRAERNSITASGRYNDVEISDADKLKYKDWESWWTDGKMQPRPKYSPDVEVTGR